MAVVSITDVTIADRLHLKNGKVIALGETWEEDGMIKGVRYGSVVGYPHEMILKIEKDQKVQSSPDNQAFRFDVWHSGMPIMEIFDVVERDNVKLLPHGIHNPSKTFNRQLCMQYLDRNHFEYRDKLMGRWATVSLWITPESQLLSTVEVKYSGSGISKKSPFRAELQNLLTEKYGEPIKAIKSDVFFESVYWQPNKRNTIELKASGNSLAVIYKDFKFVRMADMEKFERETTERRIYTKEDSGKF
jgi:hypothetical protein